MESSGVPVIYILSSGRSGTTLLDLLLGSHENIWTVGEAQVLPWEIRDERAPCGCGTSVAQCDFWKEALPQIPVEGGQYSIDYFRERHGGGKVLRWKLAASILTGRMSDEQKQAAREYGRVNAQYFQSVKRVASDRSHDVEWLVDASKDLYRLFWLRHSDRFNLRVIHLTKDPRAFVYSMIRKESSVPLKQVLRIAGRWLVENFLHSVLLQNHFSSAQTIQLKYKDVATAPYQILRDTARWLELPPKKPKEGAGNVIRKYTNHAVSGNEMRWRDTKIRLDNKWVNEMSIVNKVISYMISFPVARGLGYKW